jgi:hypothetical protein
MRRRELLAALAAQPLVVPRLNRLAAVAAIYPRRGSSRVRAGDPDWPSPAEWDGLRQHVGGRLIACNRRSSHAGRHRLARLAAPCSASLRIPITRRRGRADPDDRLGRRLDAGAKRLRRGRRDRADIAAAVDFAREHTYALSSGAAGTAISAPRTPGICC